MHSNRLYKPYQYQQNWNYWYELTKNYEKQQVDTMVSSAYDRSSLMNYITETAYPSLDGLGVPRFRVRKVLNYGYPLNLNYFNPLNNHMTNFDHIRPLPFKMRSVLIPSYSLPLQQSCAGPLAMPPFTFNRMSQPLCSLPLPPPLPEVALLYLENHVQQMFMQQYINQVPVSPSTSNWQIYQPIVLDCPQQSIMPISTFHSYQSAVIPNSMPLHSLQISLSPMDVNQTIPYCNNNYPSACRACIPPPPLTSFNNSVIKNTPIQYCPICYQIPGVILKPDVRLANEQTTSSIRLSSVLQNQPNRSRPEKQYPYMDSWSNKTPSLPPGAIIIFDEYITKNELFQEHHPSQIHRKQRRHNNKTIKRIITTKTNNTDNIESNKNPSLSKITITDSGAGSPQSLLKTKSIASSRSTYGLSFNKNVNGEKTVIISNTNKQNIDHEQRPPGVPNINIHSEDQPRNSSTIQDTDRCLDSSNSDALRDLRLSLAIGDTQIDQLSTVQSSSMKDEEEEQSEEKTNKSIYATTSTPVPSKISETQLSTTRETTGTTSSIIKTISYSALSSIRDKNFDTISTISTLKTDERTDKNLSTIESL